MRKLLYWVIGFQSLNTVSWGVMCFIAVVNEGIQESVPFLVFISVYALFSTSLVGAILALVSLKELQEISSK